MANLDKLYSKWQSLQPFPQKVQDLLNRRFTLEYNYNSNHIEGNTLTYGQTELLLLFGKVSGEGDLKDFVEMKASQVGLRMMSEEADRHHTPLTQSFIRNLHKTILREDYTVHPTLPCGVQTSFIIHAGKYKTRPNSVITRYGDRFDYASPEETPALMTDLVDWYNEAEKSGKFTPVELAALFHYRYIRIHPFEDGNGRIARLMVNYILARHGWPMIVVRSRKKRDYLEALHKTDLNIGVLPSEGAHASLEQIKHFLKYFTKLVADELTYNISVVDNDKTDAWWFDGELLHFRSPNASHVLEVISDDPYITYEKLSETIGINISALQRLLKGMEEKGYLQRRDSDKAWHVLAMSLRDK